MSDEEDEQNYFIPHRRTFHIENIPQWKISLFDEKSQLDINRIVLPIDSNVVLEKIMEIQPVVTEQHRPSMEHSTEHLSSRLQDLQPTIVDSPSKTRSILNLINDQRRRTESEISPPEGYHPLSTIIQSNEYQSISSRTTPEKSSTQRTVEQSLSTSSIHSQLIPDSIINDKQSTKRISNETNSTHLSKFITLTPINSSVKKLQENHVRYYPIASTLTSTSALLLRQNNFLAQGNGAAATASKAFLSDTIFIFLIATLTLIILLFCLGLFCLCRRTSKRNISPSFDGGSYAGLNGQAFDLPTDDYIEQQQQQQQQRRHSRDEIHMPFLPNRSSSSIPPARTSINRLLTNNEQISSPQNLALHRTARTKFPTMKDKKLKKKRTGFCCCKSQPRSSITVNARTRQ